MAAGGADLEVAEHTQQTAQSRPRRWTLRRILLGITVLAAVGVAIAGWLAYRGLQARDDIDEARAALTAVRDQTLSQDFAGARASLVQAQAATERATSRTNDPVWSVVGAIPGVGDTPQAVSTAAEQADRLADDVLPVLLDAAERLDPQQLRIAGDTLDIARLTEVAPAVDAAALEVESINAALEGATDGWVVPQIRGPVEGVASDLDELGSVLEDVAVAARVLPPMLGADGPRRYLLAFQNPAESRGTGGLMGSYGILEADAGRLQVTELGADSDLVDPAALPEGLPADFAALWGADPALWRNANLSAHFPYAGYIWTKAWESTRGQALDGVLAVDPVALSYVLQVLGPVVLEDGEVISADDILGKTLVDAYIRFEDDTDARKAYLNNVAAGVVRLLLSSPGGTRELVDVLARAVDERRLLLYSTHPEEQVEIEPLGIAGTLPADLTGPYAFVAVSNGGGNKLDYFLDRSVRYAGSPCVAESGLRTTTLDITLTNQIVEAIDLPDYVAGIRGNSPPGRQNFNRTIVAAYLQPGAVVAGVTVNGQPDKFSLGTEAGHPVLLITVTLPPQEALTISVDLREPATTTPARVDVQPLVREQSTEVRIPTCVES